MAVELVPLTPADFDRRRPSMVAEYARKMVENMGVSPEQAAAEAERQTQAMLPAGPETPGQHLTKAVEGGAELGFLWVTTTGVADSAMAWISVVEVEPEHRSKGIGSRLLLAAEDDMRARGMSRLGLHVFGRNTGAQRLYARLGYGILNQIWQRPATPAARTGIELRPLPAGDLTALVEDLVETRPTLIARDPEATPAQALGYLRMAAPDGLEAGNVLARAAYADGRRVGWIWFGLPRPVHPKLGTISYLTVDEAARRRGHGRAMVAAAAAELAAHDVPYIGLDVPGTEPAALAFAADSRLGLELISQQMAKKL
jgi:ribosomal protein S18 acetylase RimI-like enzyme